MKKKRNSSPGMFTVEMAIIFPIILFTLIGLMYIGIVYHQDMVAKTAAMRTASKVSYTWDGLGSADSAWTEDGALKSFDYTEHDPYDGLLAGVTGKSGKRKANAERYFEWVLGKNPELIGEESQENMAVEYQWSLLAPTVEAKLTKHYTNPMGHLLEAVGIGAERTTEISARVSVTDPVEFIRTAGIVYDLFKSGK